VENLKPAPNDLLQRWLVSKRVNSCRANAEDATLVEPVELANAQRRSLSEGRWLSFEMHGRAAHVGKAGRQR
jgi:hypothetical protein